MNLCHVSGCRSPRTRRGHYCNTHKSTLRRHGDPQQRGITVSQLAPYAKLLREHVRRNATSPLWPQLDGLWAALLDDCRSELQAYYEGTAAVRHRVQAMLELVQLDDGVKPKQVWEVVVAMFMLMEFEERLLKSDDAFRFQLVRRVRALSDLNVGSYYQHETRRVKRVYRDLSPRVAAAMADLLIQAFGRVGVYIARFEHARHVQHTHRARTVDRALSNLQ